MWQIDIGFYRNDDYILVVDIFHILEKDLWKIKNFWPNHNHHQWLDYLSKVEKKNWPKIEFYLVFLICCAWVFGMDSNPHEFEFRWNILRFQTDIFIAFVLHFKWKYLNTEAFVYMRIVFTLLFTQESVLW